MMKRIVGYLLCLCILCGVMPGAAFASGEPVEEPVPVAEAEEIAAEEAMVESAEEIAQEEPEEEIPAEEPLEEPVIPELPTTYTLPTGETIEVHPEDPLYERMMSQAAMLDGAWSDMDTFKKFSPRQRAGETVLPGVDVSAWQGTINWEKVANAGVEFVFLRAALRFTGSGNLAVDNYFYKNYAGAKEAGLAVGAYIYSQAITVEEGIQEARYIMDVVEGLDMDLPLVIDYEYYGTSGRLYEANLSRREGTDICLAFCETVEAAGYDGMVYGNPSMLNNDLYRDEFSRVWLAHYTTKTSYSGDYEYWQCSQSGSVNGIGGQVDLNFWFKPDAPEPTPVPTPEETSPFEDVTPDKWYYSTVLTAYEHGIVNGISATEFGPNDTASRGQVVTMLWRLMGKPAPVGEATFEDLTEDYYRDAVNWAAGQGVVNGYSDKEFCPDVKIYRQDLVTILYRLEGAPEVSGDLSAYTDGSTVQSYAEKAMIWAVSEGIINGYSDATLRPDNTASRAEVCAILMRYMDL